MAKRLYRLLDKRFYRADRLVLDLHDLAVHKVRLSENYNTAQIKRALLNGIRELEQLWDLRSAEPEERFRKLSAGKWEAVFERKAKAVKASVRTSAVDSQLSQLAESLKTRGVSAKMAERLAKQHPAERINNTISLFDWHAKRGDAKGPGFLVAGIRSPEGFEPPPPAKQNPTGSDTKPKNGKIESKPQRDVATIRAEKRQELRDKIRARRIAEYLAALTQEQLDELQRDALAGANPFYLQQYERSQSNPELAAHYQRLIVETFVSGKLNG